MTASTPPIEFTEALPASPIRKRILVADDSPPIRESLGKLLRRAGYDVAFAAHGGHVLDLALNDQTDLLLLDLNMPQMDGWAALDRLAGLKPALPIIVITAQPNQREWVMTAGAHALMEKPLDLPLLLQTIANLLREPPPGQPAPPAAGREGFRYGWPRRHGGGMGELPRRGGINE
jgi:CheY-like chemotaxis protein